MSGKMEVISLLLMFLAVSGYSYVLQPRLTVTQIAELDRDVLSEQPRDVSMSAEEKEIAAESTERRKTEEEQGHEGLTPETNPETKMERKTPAFTKNNRENKGFDNGSKTKLTPKTFPKISGEFPAADTMKDVDTDEGGEVKRGEDLETNVKGETAKVTPTDNTQTQKTLKTVNSHNTWTQEKRNDDEVLAKYQHDQIDKLRQETEEEERESKLVAGISLHKDTGEKMLTVNQSMEGSRGSEERERREEGESIRYAGRNELVEREKEDHIVVSNLTPPLSTSSMQLVRKVITQSQNPPPDHHLDNVPPSLLTSTQQPAVFSHAPTPHSKVTPQFFPPSLQNPTTIDQISVSTVSPGEVRSALLLEELLTEVLQSPEHHLKQNELEVKASPDLEDVMVKNILFKPAQTELQTTREISTVQPKRAKFTAKDLKTVAKLVEHEPNVLEPTDKPKTVKPMGNYTKRTVKQNKASPPRPQLTKPSAKTQLTTGKTRSLRPTKVNTSGKNKTVKKSKEQKRKKENKTQKPKKEEVITPTHFPYFMDNYCPPECACYGRVVQCSDKGVDKVPYGIPYNARYILLMNNQIDSIQLDLLNEYVSMEFLVLSNNQLTDGTIEGAFEGIPALKRLYLDKNLLKSVPTDLPVSLEELRLDNNQLSMMSEAAWARCPSLLVLSLSNNSLGNGSDSLPNAVLSPLCSLRTLNLDHNQLTSVPRGLPLSIKELYLKGNLIEHFRGGAFNGISELLVLDLSANRLTNKGLLRESLINATHLESLNLEGNRLKQVPQHIPQSLKTLNLEGNLISSIKKAALSILKNLEHLGLARNKIFKVAPGAFKMLPVLHQLDLCHNTLRQVPRQLPQALHSVALTHNKIQSVPRDAFCWGNKSLSLSGLVQVQLEHNLIDMGKLDAQAFRCLRGFQVVHFY